MRRPPRETISWNDITAREDYLTRFANALDDLVKQRWILPEAAMLHRGEQEWEEATK
jgi:hypothetical protein